MSIVNGAFMQSSNMEALIQGMLSSTDSPELRVRRNRDGKYSVRVYAKNREKTAHGSGRTIGSALKRAVSSRGKL